MTPNFYFPCAVYSDLKPEFLSFVKPVVEEYLIQARQKQAHELYPVAMTDNFYADPRLVEFATYVGQSAWHMLDDQGYAMDNLTTSFTEMWCQEHSKYSLMEQHIHANGSQITGFYFIDCPENSSKVLFHDLKAGKVQIGLPEKNVDDATFASNIINFAVEPGTVLLSNSWLPHSFTRHNSEDPIRFIHFNLTVTQNPMACSVQPQVEII
jgi:uncharacterized protein (TIGR02466 family)